MTANAGADINHTVTATNRAVHLVGSATDSDDNIVKYEWFNGTTLIGEGASRWYVLTQNGEYNITLKVTDADANVATDSMMITVTGGLENVLGVTKPVNEGFTISESMSNNGGLIWNEYGNFEQYVYVKDTTIGDSSVRLVAGHSPDYYNFQYISSKYYIFKTMHMTGSRSSITVGSVAPSGSSSRVIYTGPHVDENGEIIAIKETSEGFFLSFVDAYNEKVSCVYDDGESFQIETMITNRNSLNREVFDTHCGKNGNFHPEVLNEELQYRFTFEHSYEVHGAEYLLEPIILGISSLYATNIESDNRLELLKISTQTRHNGPFYFLKKLIHISDSYYVVTKEYTYPYGNNGYPLIESLEFGKFTGENKSTASLDYTIRLGRPNTSIPNVLMSTENSQGLYLHLSEQYSLGNGYSASEEVCVHFNPLTSTVSREVMKDNNNEVYDTKCGAGGIFSI